MIMNEELKPMTLEELKKILEMDPADTSGDYRLSMLLESAIVAAQEYCDKIDFMEYIDPITGQILFPAAIRLGIAEYVQTSMNTTEKGTVVSESIGGMSRSFSRGDRTYATAFQHWSKYHSDIKFIQVRRRR